MAIFTIKKNHLVDGTFDPAIIPKNSDVRIDQDAKENLTHLPDGLEVEGNLNLMFCTRLTHLPNNLRVGGDLELMFCTSLTYLPNNLRVGGDLELNRCTGLTSLPDGLSVGGSIELGGCTSLARTPETIAQLEKLKNAGCSVTLPVHFSPTFLIDEAMGRLMGVEILNPTITSTNTHELIFRFLNEKLTERGIDEVVQSVTPFLEAIEQNPQHLEWVEPIAARYLQECVNQPVAGFAHISAWLEVAKATTFIEKINAARYPMAVQALTDYVTIQNKEKGGMFEAEIGNVLLREVHQKLVAEYKIAAWNGVPGAVAHEELSPEVERWKTPENVNAAYDAVIAALRTSPDDVVEFLLFGDNIRYWGGTGFPEAIRKIKQDFEPRKEALERLKHPEKLWGKASGECQAFINQYKEQLGSRNDNERDIYLFECETLLANNEVTALIDVVSSSTKAAFEASRAPFSFIANSPGRPCAVLPTLGRRLNSRST